MRVSARRTIVARHRTEQSSPTYKPHEPQALPQILAPRARIHSTDRSRTVFLAAIAADGANGQTMFTVHARYIRVRPIRMMTVQHCCASVRVCLSATIGTNTLRCPRMVLNLPVDESRSQRPTASDYGEPAGSTVDVLGSSNPELTRRLKPLVTRDSIRSTRPPLHERVSSGSFAAVAAGGLGAPWVLLSLICHAELHPRLGYK